jgi:hypothetical protein
LFAAQAGEPHVGLVGLNHCENRIIPGFQHYQFVIRPTGRRKARRPIFTCNSNRYAEPPHLEIMHEG